MATGDFCNTIKAGHGSSITWHGSWCKLQLRHIFNCLGVVSSSHLSVGTTLAVN